ncbi:MAG: nucleotidyltransferase family protein [Oscillospiraceae bacterium]|nr:nucleotidyltransferase family protein [Oscillospiraceae bacterium]
MFLCLFSAFFRIIFEKPLFRCVGQPEGGTVLGKTAGIIAEYNPLHSGHVYHMEATRRAGYDRIVAVMSPHAVQRGEPAIFSKWTRAAAALRCGADLVVELPTPWAVSSAARFAEAGVFLLTAMGCVDAVSFGSESGDLSALRRCADACLEAEQGERLPSLLKEGLSYAAARDRAVAEGWGEETASLLRSPNNILAVEYLKAIRRLHASLDAFTVARLGAGHDSPQPQQGIASASALRQLIRGGELLSALEFLPEQAAELFEKDLREGTGGASLSALEPALLYRLRTMSLADFRALPDVSEGLEQRLFKASRRMQTLDSLIEEVRTRRYPLSRVRRILYSALLGLTEESAVGHPPYLRVLAFNERGQALLRRMRRESALPVYHSFARLERDFPRLAETELLATDLFRMACPDIRDAHSEYQDRRPFSAAEKGGTLQ